MQWSGLSRMNELDLLLAELVEASRHRRQSLRTATKIPKRGKINLARQTQRDPAGTPRAGAC